MMASRLIGRGQELLKLQACLDDAQGGLARWVVLRGEPGIGKTRLAEELATRAAEAGALVAWSRSWEEGGAPPGWAVREVLRELSGSPALSGARAALEAAGAALGVGHHEAERFARFEAVAEALAIAARQSPIVAIFDDLQWADATSLLLLKFVARRAARSRLLLVGTVRDLDAPVDAETARLLADVAREGWVIALSGLTEDEVVTLATSAGAPEGSASRIQVAAGGNPLFVEELALHLSTRGGAAQGELSLPEGVRATLARRLTTLPPGTRALISRAAAIGAEIDVALLREATVQAGPAWSDADLRSALEHGVLVDQGKTLRFRHDLVRQVALADGIDAARDHRAIAAALEARGGDLAEIARHLFACGEARAIELAVLASHRASARLDYEQAATLLDRALGAAQAAGELVSVEIAELRLALGEALLHAGHGARGRQECLAAAAVGRRLERPDVLARAALAYGSVVRMFMVDRDHVELLESALASALDDPALLATLRARLAAAMQPSETPEVPLSLAREAIAEARAIGDEAVLARVLDAARPAFRPIDDLDERIAIDRETVRLATALGDGALGLRAGQRLSAVLLQRGDVVGARAHLDEVERAVTERVQPSMLHQVAQARAADHLLTGRFDDADAAMRTAARHWARIPDPPTSPVVNQLPFNRMLLLHARSRVTDHAALLAFDPSVPPPVRDLVIAALRARIGAIEETRAAMARLYARGDQLHGSYVGLVMLPSILVELDDAPRAIALLPLIEQLGDTCAVHTGLGLCEGATQRLVGMLLAVVGRFDEAIAAFARARAMNRAMGATPFVHATDLADAEARLRRGTAQDRAAAAVLLESAAQGFDALGMTTTLARARLRLESVGGPLVKAAAPERAASVPVLGALRREGEGWTVDVDGTTTHLKDAHGFHYLAHLIARPGVDVHVADLSAVIRGATDANPGDAGPMLDSEAKAAYRHRLADLREMVEEATLLGDAGRAERGRTEIEFLAAELSRAFGLGGRERRAASSTERQRVNVTLRIRKAIKKMSVVLPGLGDHLDRSVSTGIFCSYDPPPGPRVTT